MVIRPRFTTAGIDAGREHVHALVGAEGTRASAKVVVPGPVIDLHHERQEEFLG